MLNSVQKLLMAFLALIVGMALLGQIATSSYAITAPIYVIDESLDISSARIADAKDLDVSVNLYVSNRYTDDWRVTAERPSECDISQNFVLKNQTGATTALTTDYTISATGVVNVKNVTILYNAPTNITSVSYSYCESDYVVSRWARNSITLVSGLFAIALLGVGLGLFYSLAKDAGLMN
jgi:hypothetical protein